MTNANTKIRACNLNTTAMVMKAAGLDPKPTIPELHDPEIANGLHDAVAQLQAEADAAIDRLTKSIAECPPERLAQMMGMANCDSWPHFNTTVEIAGYDFPAVVSYDDDADGPAIMRVLVAGLGPRGVDLTDNLEMDIQERLNAEMLALIPTAAQRAATEADEDADCRRKDRE